MQTITDNCEWAGRNPFTDDYVREEVAHYGTDEHDYEGVAISMATPVLRIDDYLNRNFLVGNTQVPLFKIDGVAWMSLTRMELQSQHLAIQFSQDRCAALGLGMGHYVLRAMARDDVESIDVYERDSRVIKMFQRFKNRCGFDKINFIVGDARKLCRGKQYDFMYVDIYPDMLGNEIVSDIEMFLGNNHVEVYHFWGRERVLFDAIRFGLGGHIDYPTMQYFRMWHRTPANEDNARITLSDLAHNPIDQGYVEDVLRAFDDAEIDP